MLYTVTQGQVINYIKGILLSEYLRPEVSLSGLIPGGRIVQRFVYRRDCSTSRHSQRKWLRGRL